MWLKPKYRPICTITSTTENTMPMSEAKNRSRSWKRFREASVRTSDMDGRPCLRSAGRRPDHRSRRGGFASRRAAGPVRERVLFRRGCAPRRLVGPPGAAIIDLNQSPACVASCRMVRPRSCPASEQSDQSKTVPRRTVACHPKPVSCRARQKGVKRFALFFGGALHHAWLVTVRLLRIAHGAVLRRIVALRLFGWRLVWAHRDVDDWERSVLLA